jgi:hypothetical protein
MRIGTFRFGSIEIDDVTYRYNVVIDGERHWLCEETG